MVLPDFDFSASMRMRWLVGSIVRYSGWRSDVVGRGERLEHRDRFGGAGFEFVGRREVTHVLAEVGELDRDRTAACRLRWTRLHCDSDARASRSERSLSASVSWALARTTGFASGSLASVRSVAVTCGSYGPLVQATEDHRGHFAVSILGQAGQDFAAGLIGGGFCVAAAGGVAGDFVEGIEADVLAGVLALEGQELGQELGRRVVLGLELFGFFARDLVAALLVELVALLPILFESGVERIGQVDVFLLGGAGMRRLQRYRCEVSVVWFRGRRGGG